MNDLMVSLRVVFTFYFRDFLLPHTIDKCEKLNKFLKEKDDKKKDDKFYMHFGESWEEVPFTRRFLLASYPHLHYEKKVEEEIVGLLKEHLKNEKLNLNLRISIVQGGSGAAELQIDNSQISDEEIVPFLKLVKSFQEEITKNGKKDFTNLCCLNRFFVQEINELLKKFANVEELKLVKWDEFSKEDKADYIVSIQKKDNCYEYATIDPFSLDENYFYQQPYLVLYFPYTEKGEQRVEVINNYFGGIPFFLSEGVFGKETLKEEGIGKLVIKNEQEENIAEIYIDPTKILAFIKEEFVKDQIDPIIHRALFFARTIMHYCILWDARLQVIFQEVYGVLKEVEKKKEKIDELFECLEKLNDIQLTFTKDEAELYNSFVWRYSSFLPSKLGYLVVIYDLMEKLFDLRNKVENLRNSATELRQMFEFTDNIIRGYLAPRLPQLLKEKGL